MLPFTTCSKERTNLEFYGVLFFALDEYAKTVPLVSGNKIEGSLIR